MAKFLFVLSRGPEDPTRAVRCFQFAKIALEKGHDVTVFLVDDGVYLTNIGLAERVKAPTGDELIGYMRYVQEKGGKMLVCKPCAEARMIGADDLPKGAEIATGYQLIDLAVDSKVFSF
jgi:predicted peroxiredoxin